MLIRMFKLILTYYTRISGVFIWPVYYWTKTGYDTVFGSAILAHVLSLVLFVAILNFDFGKTLLAHLILWFFQLVSRVTLKRKNYNESIRFIYKRTKLFHDKEMWP
jgi:hypothetical protein